MRNLITLGLIIISTLSLAQTPLWMRYSAISPDGSKIAFNYKGNIYLVDSKGGEARQLTTHKEHDFMPIWSPDGKEIAFASNRYGNFDVFIMPSEGGKATRLTYYSSDDYPCSIDKDGEVMFTATRLDDPMNTQFPSSRMPELYSVTKDRKLKQVLTTPSEDALWNKDKTKLLYHDKKGYEDPWRKHHVSSITRDVWLFDPTTKEHTMLTDFEGEDRTPKWSSDEKTMYFLSEQSGSFNIWKQEIKAGASKSQITKHDKHPVRFLTLANNGVMCYGYDGEIYTVKEGGEPVKVKISIKSDDDYNDVTMKNVHGSVTEVVLSPNGKEIAFVSRGEVFVTALDYKETKRITNTPEQERSVSFSPDGRSLLFAGERNNSWNIYQVKLTRKDEKFFYSSTVLKEEAIVTTDKETFQAAFSPDGKEVSFYEERTELKVINLATKEMRVVLPAKYNYSYSDGDQAYEWSPDSKWFLIQYMPYDRWNNDIALVSADGKQVINLTESGYECYSPQWMMGGEAILWFSGRNGMRNHGSWGHESDAYAMFLTEKAYKTFKLTKSEYEVLKDEKEKKKDKDGKKKGKKGKKKEEVKKPVKPIKFDLKSARDRVARLTIHSSALADAILTKDGNKLYYLSAFEKGFDLWVHDFKKRETKLLTKLNTSYGRLKLDKEEEKLYVLSSKKIVKIDVENGKSKPVSYKAQMEYNMMGEYSYMFDHAWRQTLKKFYLKDMHGVDWAFYKEAYKKFLPHINNGHDFAEMLSEMLGELNASHTGGRYFGRPENGDHTASLGIYPDYNYAGPGVKIKAILGKSPLTIHGAKAKAGDIITKINGETINNLSHYYELVKNQAGTKLLVTIKGTDGKEKDQYVKAVGGGRLRGLVYENWVKGREEVVKKLSNGKLGYVHVEGMDDASFREVYSKALGKYCDTDALIVDTRFNGGGWLHDDLATFLSGKDYAEFIPRGQKIGHEPLEKWYKPTIVLAGEGNYSDAHGFPFAYRSLNIGKVVGMPIPGTMTAVWWERLINKSVVFGIPQVGMVGNDGKLQENNQFEPDIKVKNDYKSVAEGVDKQLEVAVKELLK